MNQNIEKLLQIAKNEIGYLEKASNNNLYSKTANAGYKNYTKYWTEIYPKFQGSAWCACFVTWCFVQAFGQENAKKLLKHYPYVYCPTMANLFTLNTTPKVGDIVIFYRNKEFVHTGIVYSVNGNKFETIEGNTSGGNTIVANGGGVCKKSYLLSNLSGTKFCTPNWNLLETKSTTHWAEQYKNILKTKGIITDDTLWSYYDYPVQKSHIIAMLDKLTGGTWTSGESDSSIHWSQPNVISLCGKGIISNKEIYLTNPDADISKAQLLGLVAKIINNGTNELSSYESRTVDHWGRNYLDYLCDKSIITSPEVWCNDFEGTVTKGSAMALICKAFQLEV